MTPPAAPRGRAKRRSRALLPHEREDVVQAKVEWHLTAGGWRWFHRPDVQPRRPEQRGLPDVLAVHPCGRALFIECKSSRGTLRPEQEQWLGWLRRGGFEVHVLTPKDLERIPTLLACGCGVSGVEAAVGSLEAPGAALDGRGR